MRRKALAALLLFCVAIYSVQAQSVGEARLASARVVEVTPGKIVTASVLVANPSGADAIYEETFALPATWLRISPPATPILVPAGGEEVRLIAFAVPATSPAGSFDLEYLLTNSRTQSPVATATVTVVVLPVVKLELIREDQTDTVIAGEAYEARLRIINRGNSKLKIVIDALAAPACPVRLDETEFWIEPASSRAVRAHVRTDVELRQPMTQVINFKATAAGGDGVVISTRSVAVNIIPRISGDLDPYVRLPAQARMTAVAENGSSGVQAELSGAGFIDEARTQRVEFLFRGPSLENQSIYGLRDEHRISYFGPTLDVHLGDRNYALSPLIQRFNYGRGAAVDVHAGPTNVGVFYMETLDRVRNFQTAGSYLRRDYTPTFSVQANALYKSESGLAQQHTGPLGLFSLQPHFDFGKRLDLDLEYGVSTAASGTAAQAHRVQAQGELLDEVTYALERVKAGDKFFGYYHGTESTQAALTFPIYGPLRGKASFNQDARDAYAGSFIDRLSPAAFATPASRQIAYRPGLLLRVSPRTDLSLEYQHVERHAAYLAGPQESLEHSARLGVGHSRGMISVQAFAELGVVEQSASGVADASSGNQTVSRYSTYLSYRPTARQSYSLFGAFGSSTNHVDPTQRSQSVGASAQWSLSTRLNAGLHYARNHYDARTARVQDNASGTISYTRANRDVVALRARWLKDSSTGRADPSLTISYTIPFGLPVSKKKSGGVLHGRVLEVVGDTSQPMSRVIVTANGITAVTDRKGEFHFPSLVPGEYQVNIEQRSLGADRVTLEPVPLTIEVEKGRVVELAISVVRSSRVRATVAIFGSTRRVLAPNGRGASDGAFESIGGLAAGLVELSNGTQVLRQVTDAEGSVSFDNLRPGKWTLRVYENNLPEHHVVETAVSEVEVEPGQSRELLVRILPKPRPVRFIDEGSISPSTRDER